MRDRWLLPRVDWPGDPFAIANTKTINTAPLPGHGKRRTDDHLCRCGCKLPHNHAVSRLITVHEDRHVLWYRNVDHLNRHTSGKQSEVSNPSS
jgi:hypothetical protein